MIQYTSKDSFLEIPKGLGNFSTNGGGGGGEDLGPLSGSVVTLSASTVNVASGLESLSSTTENIGELVGALSGSVETQGDAIADLLLDTDALDTRVSGNTDDIAALSALTSANTADIAAISGAMETVQVKAYYLDRMTKAERAALFEELWVANGESNFEPSKYKFYELEDNDEYKGWCEVRMARFDGGRKVCFSAIFQSRNSNNVYQRGIAIEQDGTYRKNIFSAVVPLVDVTPISAQTSANTAQIEALSAATEALSATTEDIYNTIFYEDESGETYSQIDDLWTALGEKQDVLEAGDGISLDSPNISVKAGKGLYFKEDGTMEVLLGNGLQYSGSSNALTVKIGEGLAFSGSTLVVSGGSGNGPRVIFLNKLSQQECLDLYDELSAQYDYLANGWTSAFTENEYQFYIDLREYADQVDYSVADHYEGFFPMQVCRMHPSDYGGGAFFTGVEQDREGNGNLICIRFCITYEGQVDKGTWWNSPASDPSMQFNLRINNDGTIANDQDWSCVSDSNNAARLVMQYFESTQYGDVYSEGKVKWVNMYPTTYNNETKWYWVWAADICIGTTMYSGVWGMIQDQWYQTSDVPPQVLQWTSGATYESQTYPSLL